MAAQMVRLNTIASNIANVGGLASSDASHRAIRPVFETEYADNLHRQAFPQPAVNVVELEKKLNVCTCHIRVLMKPVMSMPRR